MRGPFPVFEESYPPGPDRNFLVQAALIEGEGYCQWTRIREVGEFARRLEYRTLGVPHCPDMASVAHKVAGYLSSIGIEPVLPLEAVQHDPMGQARQFNEISTDLNVLSGMCVGHEAIFIKESASPVVGLVARDARLAHNPAAAIYTARSYLKKELFGHWNARERPPFQGWTTELLEEAAGRAGSAAGEGGPRSRLAEAMDLAHHLGVTRVGVSFCVGFRREAEILSKLLKTNGFSVSSVCCKTGATPKEDAGITDAQKVRPGSREMICNPRAQAELLNRESIQLGLVLGQCVGHDAVTFGSLEAPSICLVAKDRVLGHNTTAAPELS
jgi:uncharacterized metal-binding protein